MSLDSLLDSLLAVPRIPPGGIPGEPLKDAKNKAGSLGSLGSPGKSPLLDKALMDACRGLPITSVEVNDTLALEDIEDLRTGDISTETLAAFARSLVQRREMRKGIVPPHYTEHAACGHCGPIWLWFPGEVLGCPWCWNRVEGYPIPRPVPIRCGDCFQYMRIDHPHLGHCTKGELEDIAGLWDTDRRYCESYIPTK